jgi:hypothetical protein
VLVISAAEKTGITGRAISWNVNYIPPEGIVWWVELNRSSVPGIRSFPAVGDEINL